MTEREAYVAFAAFPGIGPQRFKLLTEYFGSAQKAWSASAEELIKIGLGGKLTQKLVDFRAGFDPRTYEQQLLQREIKIITRIESSFPQQLLEIPDPPIALFIKGTFEVAGKKFIGIVGTRKPTAYGREITARVTRDLALSGLGIVSGMARGIDGVAHRTAIEAGAYTIAVLGCGVDIIYPPDHKDLYVEIIARSGAVISEVPPGHTVLKGLFPARNRIISGISLGIVVTEGAQDSGSLITARLAAEQGREVFAVPGPITSYLSVGPSKLIKQGAKIVTEVGDILEEFNIKNEISKIKNSNKISNNGRTLSPEEEKLVGLLTQGEMLYDEIIRESGLPASEVGSLLSLMELGGIIRALGNGKYGLNSG